MKDVLNFIVSVAPDDKPLPLVTVVHGPPARLVCLDVTLHEAPDGLGLDGEGLHPGHDQDPSYLVNLDPATEKLSCEGIIVQMSSRVEPPKKGHFGNSHFCPLLRGCPLLGG